MVSETARTTVCLECGTEREALVKLVDALMKLGVDFELHRAA